MTRLCGSGNVNRSPKKTDTFPNYNWMLKLGLIETAQIMFPKYYLPGLILKEIE